MVVVPISLSDALGLGRTSKGDELFTDIQARLDAIETSLLLHQVHCQVFGFHVHNASVAAVLASSSLKERRAAMLINQTANAARHAAIP